MLKTIDTMINLLELIVVFLVFSSNINLTCKSVEAHALVFEKSAKIISNLNDEINNQEKDDIELRETKFDVGYQLQGRWNDWSDWTQCTKTCGKGTKKRTRSCGSKPKENGGFPCEGPRTQWNLCNTNVCIVEGTWGKWSKWGTCSATCDGGTQLRNRTCLDASTSVGKVVQCSGPDYMSKSCNEESCDGRCGQEEEWHSPIVSESGNDCTGFTSDYCTKLDNDTTADTSDINLQRFLIKVVNDIPSVYRCQQLCQQRQSNPENCQHFVFDKKNCNCKLYSVSNTTFLYEFNDGCDKLGGTKYPDLGTCPAFLNEVENCNNFREGKCRYSGYVLEHLDNCRSAEICQLACQWLDMCRYFNYRKSLKDCELLTTPRRNCDIIRGPPFPDFQQCLDNDDISWND